jgi:Peptidase inhibitor family I36
MKIASFRGIGASAAAVLGLLIGLTVAAGPARAADSTCPFDRTFCAWEDTGFSGARFNVQALNPTTGTCVDLAAHGWGAGRIESARNTANRTATLWSNRNCTGSSYLIQPGGAYSPVTFASNSVYVY